MRGKMGVFVLEGHNIRTASKMKKAIDSNRGVRYVETAVVQIEPSKQSLTTHSLKSVAEFQT